jgi:hypothetical protein
VLGYQTESSLTCCTPQDFALKYFNTNFRAQTNDALRVLRAVEALGGRATPEDIAMLVKVRSLFQTTHTVHFVCSSGSTWSRC